jgi:hypothetical protein
VAYETLAVLWRDYRWYSENTLQRITNPDARSTTLRLLPQG